MSVAEAAPPLVRRPARRLSTRFLRSELWLIFGRRRNWAGLAILAAVPVIIAVVGPAGIAKRGRAGSRRARSYSQQNEHQPF